MSVKGLHRPRMSRVLSGQPRPDSLGVGVQGLGQSERRCLRHPPCAQVRPQVIFRLGVRSGSRCWDVPGPEAGQLGIHVGLMHGNLCAAVHAG